MLLGLDGNFSTSRFCNPYSLVETKDRKSASSSSDLLPENFGLRDEKQYKEDVIALKAGQKEPHGLKRDSILNSIPHFHCARYGFIAPCIDHDIFAGRDIQCNKKQKMVYIFLCFSFVKNSFEISYIVDLDFCSVDFLLKGGLFLIDIKVF